MKAGNQFTSALIGALVGCATFISLGGLTGSLSLGVTILCVAIGCIACTLLHDIRHPERRPVKILLSVYFLLFYAVPGSYHAATGRFPFFGYQYSERVILTGASLVLLFVVLVPAGYHWARPITAKVNERERIVLGESAQNFPISATVLMIVAIGLASYIGWGNVLAPRGEQEGDGLGGLILMTVMRACGFAGFLYTLIGKFRTRHLILVALAAVVFLLTNSPLAVSRFVLAAQFLVIYILWTDFDRRDRAVLVGGLLVGAFTAFPIISALSRRDVHSLLDAGLFSNYFRTGDFDGFQSTLNVIEYVEGAGLNWGRNLLSALFFFVPRSIWPGKSPGTGVDAATYVGYPFTNISAPLPAEFFVDFGFAGVVLGAIATGALIRVVDVELFKRKSSVHSSISYAFVFGYSMIVFRGSLVAVVGPLVTALATVAVVKFCGRVRFGER